MFLQKRRWWFLSWHVAVCRIEKVVWWGETVDKWSSTQWASMDLHEESPGRWCLAMSMLGGCCCVKKGSWCRKVAVTGATNTNPHSLSQIYKYYFTKFRKVEQNKGLLSLFPARLQRWCKFALELVEIMVGKIKPCNGQYPSNKKKGREDCRYWPHYLRSEI